MVVSVDGAGSATGCSNANVQTRPCISFRLVVGRDLFLWHLLVAHLSDDPLCAYGGAARMRPVAASGHIRRSVPGSILCRARAHRFSLWSRRLVSRAAALGFA